MNVSRGYSPPSILVVSLMSPVGLASCECGFAETGRPALCIRLSAPGTINGLLKERHNKNFVYVAKQKLDIEV